VDFVSLGAGRVAEVLKRSPVTDTDVTCRSCGALAWDVVELRTEPDDDYYRMRGLVCRACGQAWGGFRPTGRCRPGQKPYVREHDGGLPDGRAARERELVERARFPVYVVDPELAYERRLAQWGGGASEISDLAFIHQIQVGDRRGSLRVRSAPAARRGDLVRVAVGTLTKMLWDKAQGELDWGLSSPAQDLKRDQMLREAEQRADNATISYEEIVVDGERVPIAVAQDPAGPWCAAASIGSASVSIAGEGVDSADVRLIELAG
jgi:hypothetical protein